MMHAAFSLATLGLGLRYTRRALTRMAQRRIDKADIDRVLSFGRMFQNRHVIFHVIGKREIDFYSPVVDLSDLDGVHVLLSPDASAVITVYRDPRFRETVFHAVDRQRRRARRRVRRQRLGY